MPKRHQEPVLVFRELKPKFAVSAQTLWSVSSPGSCEVKPQAVPGLAQDRLLKNSRVKSVERARFGCLLFSEAPEAPRGPSETNVELEQNTLEDQILDTKSFGD